MEQQAFNNRNENYALHGAHADLLRTLLDVSFSQQAFGNSVELAMPEGDPLQVVGGHAEYYLSDNKQFAHPIAIASRAEEGYKGVSFHTFYDGQWSKFFLFGNVAPPQQELPSLRDDPELLQRTVPLPLQDCKRYRVLFDRAQVYSWELSQKTAQFLESSRFPEMYVAQRALFRLAREGTQDGDQDQGSNYSYQ